jgi:uncharacterized protein (DUF885 family)
MKTENMTNDETKSIADFIQRLQDVEEKLKKLQHIKDVFLDNQEFIQTMKISKRTAQTWRDEGVISFSQVGNKIYYRVSDINELLNKNRSRATR